MKISRAIWAAMIFRLSPLVSEAKPSADSSATYQFARINEGVFVFSYLSSHGFTLTTVIDEQAGTVVSFASNEKELVVQHGSLDARKRAA